jgi:hypothetical protein
MTTIPVTLDGVQINSYEHPSGDVLAATFVVESVEGFYDTPDLDTHDEELVLTDGSLKGSTIIKSREIVITGGVIGDHYTIAGAREILAGFASSRKVLPLEVGDPYLGRTLVSYVHSSAGLKLRFINPTAIRYQLTFRASDPRLYSGGIESSILQLAAPGTGRIYPREYPDWNYGAGPIPGVGDVWNYGNVDAPVVIDYFGPLGETRLVSPDSEGVIRVAPLFDGEQLTVYSDTLAAVSPSNSSRASYVLAGSSPMLIPAYLQTQWQILGTGFGYVQLSWRSTWI